MHIGWFGDGHLRRYGVRKLWPQLQPEGITVARCTVARPMWAMGRRGVVRGKAVRPAVSDKPAPCPLDRVNRDCKAQCPGRNRRRSLQDRGGPPARPVAPARSPRFRDLRPRPSPEGRKCAVGSLRCCSRRWERCSHRRLPREPARHRQRVPRNPSGGTPRSAVFYPFCHPCRPHVCLYRAPGEPAVGATWYEP
ncbi:MAG: hypothetical protein EA356_13850 [Geminicoccaceae bacterium]|nr:MAG: hypothetical protein EA356_13850 [Geminicoccaceae bacterium]